MIATLFFFKIFYSNFLLMIRYDPLSSCLVDFKGRANIASIKNFQLIESTPASMDGSGNTGSGGFYSNQNRGNKDDGEDKEREMVFLQLGKVRYYTIHIMHKYRHICLLIR